MKSPRDLACGLLEKASHDLIAARATLATRQALDMVCFHAQQAVEKCLKALLSLEDVEYPWRHDIGELLELVRKHYPDLVLDEKDLLELSPFAVEARYDVAWAPGLPEAQSALEVAQRVHETAGRIVIGDRQT